MNVPELLDLLGIMALIEISHQKTFRAEILNGENAPNKVLYVLHGYGQLVRYFIRKFASVPDDWLIVAPEGMHRFYLKGSSGRVGASWMTKEDRENDISDNISYLNRIDQEISKQFDIQERHLLGFSQGGATAARWEQLGNVSFHSITLWASVYPPDLEPIASHKTKDRLFVIGSEDEFYDLEAQRKIETFYRQLQYQIIKYQGRHDIVNETLTAVIDKIEGN